MLPPAYKAPYELQSRTWYESVYSKRRSRIACVAMDYFTEKFSIHENALISGFFAANSKMLRYKKARTRNRDFPRLVI
jgi:hypothetical protein